jgi:hypothetical protein
MGGELHRGHPGVGKVSPNMGSPLWDSSAKTRANTESTGSPPAGGGDVPQLLAG